MIIVDTHCHTGTNKYEPIESLIFHMEQASVSKAVLIQHAGNTNNSYHVQCLHSHPNRFASAMIVEADDTGEKIDFWAKQGIVGIRLHADSRSDTIDPLAHWRTADKLNLVVSVPCSIPTLLGDEFSQVLKTFPDLTIVIEHLGGANYSMKSPYQEFKSMLALSRYPNLLSCQDLANFADYRILLLMSLQWHGWLLRPSVRSELCGEAIIHRLVQEKVTIIHLSFL